MRLILIFDRISQFSIDAQEHPGGCESNGIKIYEQDKIERKKMNGNINTRIESFTENEEKAHAQKMNSIKHKDEQQKLNGNRKDECH